LAAYDVYKNISFGLENLKWKKEEIAARVDEVMKTLQISEFKDRYPSELSGGQQQRVAIARTLAPNPMVLFMDEPLSNLDAKLRGEMRTELKRLHRDTDSTFVYVTHDQLEAMTLASRTCLINKGLMQQYDKPLFVYNNPSNLFVADFVGSPTMNFIKAKAAKVSEKVLNLEFLNYKVKYTSEKPINLTSENVIVGIRPEFLHIKEDGAIDGLAYSTLPSGMETTVKINLNDTILSAVQFGSVDYAFDQKIKFDIIGKRVVLFDEESKLNIALGSCEVIK
jgi:multiple sugar transport system ATP-binding protein